MQKQTESNGVREKVQTIKSVLEAQANKHGEVPDDARIEITASYENRQGNISLKNGEVWRVSDDRINFSQNIGEVDEDSYFLRFNYGRISLISVSERGTETEIGELSNIVIED
jgi:hypothetical protein